MLFVTGMGPTLPAMHTGELGPANPPVTYVHPTVLIDSVEAEVLWSGYAPGMVGLYQINLRIPPAARSGVLDLSVVVNGVWSQTSRIVIQ